MAKANPLEGAQEIQRLLVDYAKQETINPLKTLTKYLSMGLSGALFVFLGILVPGFGYFASSPDV